MLRKKAGEMGFPGRQRMTSDSVGFELQSYEKSGEINKKRSNSRSGGQRAQMYFCSVASKPHFSAGRKTRKQTPVNSKKKATVSLVFHFSLFLHACMATRVIIHSLPSSGRTPWRDRKKSPKHPPTTPRTSFHSMLSHLLPFPPRIPNSLMQSSNPFDFPSSFRSRSRRS